MSITTNQATGELERLQEEVVYVNYFRTSQHQTFAQKVASFAFVNDWQWAVEGLVGVQDIGKTVVGEERFDAFEITGVQKASGKAGEMQPLVQFRAKLGTPWHAALNELVYHNTAPKNPGLSVGWADRPSHIGTPPIRAISLAQGDEQLGLTDAMISSGLVTGSGGKVSYVYQLPYYMFYDYYYLQQQAANSGLNNQGVRYLLDTSFVPIYSGQYPVSVGYVLPGESKMRSVQKLNITKP